MNAFGTPEGVELLDVLDAFGTPTGERQPRALVHREGLWHRTFHLWVVSVYSGVPHVLMQRRSPHKDLEPNKLDVAVGGHLRSGEGVGAGLREVEEELGLAVSLEALVYLGCLSAVRTYPHATDREFQEIYLLRRDAPLESYTLDPAEVAALYALPLAGAVALYERGTPLAAAGIDAFGRPQEARLTAADLITCAREDASRVLRRLRVLGEDWGGVTRTVF
jgi:8-oxo-dGTP pyrophosphatase MutT (NUDIX family)